MPAVYRILTKYCNKIKTAGYNVPFPAFQLQRIGTVKVRKENDASKLIGVPVPVNQPGIWPAG
jgi:hypothetical protein